MRLPWALTTDKYKYCMDSLTVRLADPQAFVDRIHVLHFTILQYS